MNKIVVKSPIFEAEIYYKGWWMEPNGILHQLYKISNYGHWDFAKSQLKKFGLPERDPAFNDPISYLRDRGWVRLTYNYHKNGALHYSYSKNKPLSEILMAKINKLAFEIEATKLVDDILDKEFPLLQEKIKDKLNEIEGNEPDIYYHVTFKDSIFKIKNQGIKPQIKPTWAGSEDNDVRGNVGVYCFDNYYDAVKWAVKTAWHIKDRIPVIVKFKDTNKDFIPDEHWESTGSIGKWLVKQSSVKPENIISYQKFDKEDLSPELVAKINSLYGSNRNINEGILLDERLSFADLYDETDDKRIEKSKKIRVQPLLVTTENNNEVWKFSYNSAERIEFKDTGRVGHKGNIYFFKDSIGPNDNAEDLDCMVDCDCKDFKFRWAYANAQDDASFIGSKSLNKAINRAPIKTNPKRKKQLCKHLAGLAKYLTTNIDRARQRAHLRRRPVNIFETMNELADKGRFTTTYDDNNYNIKEYIKSTIVKEEIKIEKSIFENLQKLGFSPHDDHPSMPINWHSIDLFSDHPWSIPSIKRWLGLSDKFSAIYPAVLEVNSLTTKFEDQNYDWNKFKIQKGGFPPIVVVREENGTIDVADGGHRVKWAKQSGYKTIGAWVVDKMIQRDLEQKQPLKETRIIQPEEALEEGYITLYHGTTWPVALKAKKGELGPQNLRSLVSNVLVNVFHENPQDAGEIYDREIKKNGGRPVPSQKVLFLTGDKETAERYACSATKYGGEIFADVLGQYIWDKNRNTNGNLSDIMKSHLMTDQPAVITINVPLSMVFTHPDWRMPVRDKLRTILKNARENPELRKHLKDMNIEVFVKETIPAKFIQRIDKVTCDR